MGITGCLQRCLVVALLGAGALLTTKTQTRAADAPDGDTLKPQWKPGDQWVVETVTQSQQYRSDPKEKPPTQKLQWQFTVQKQEKIGGQDCHVVQIVCQVQGKKGKRQQPVTKIWTDQKTMALRQIQTQLPVQGSYRTVTESYQFKDGKQSPVLGPLTAIPLDMPLFLPQQAKGLERFSYEAIDGPSGVKAVGDVGFAFEVEQSMTLAKPSEIKGLLPQDFTKDLNTKPTVEVRLKTLDRNVRQLWQPSVPWPVYSNNGLTECRLIKVTRAKPAGSSSNLIGD